MWIIAIIAGVVILFFGSQYLIVLRMKLKRGKQAPPLQGVYGKAIKSKKTSLFYFYSPQCGACRTMTPLVEQYTKNNPRCFKIDITRDSKTAGAFGIMATPSTAIVENGVISDFIVGPKPQAEFVELLEKTREVC